MNAFEIIKQGLTHGESYELINERLKQAGFNFHIEKNRQDVWTEEEMKSGLIPANKEIQVSCAEGTYKITYDADGYAVKAVRINV